MITLERWVHVPLQWIATQWNRLAEQTAGEAIPDSGDGMVEARPSRWSLSAFRVSLSERGRLLTRLMKRGSDRSEITPQDEAILYERDGRLNPIPTPTRSDSWTRPPERQGHWSTPAFRVALSRPGRMAGGALASTHAAPGELDRFVQQIQDERRAGLYPAEVFQQARELLRKSAQLEAAPHAN
ncbi:MAG: hypothetical protein HQM00_01650 [Magnetococcales bacterium]|nr:hypothetical protein [Magnetococcales bacterium]